MALSRNQVALEGPPLSKSYALRFLGTRNLASSRVEKFIQLQRTASGWRDLHATGPQNEQVKLYIEKDKNGQQNKTEILTKRLCATIQKQYPSFKFYAKRREGVVSCDYTPIARLKVPDPDTYSIEWNQAMVSIKSIDTRLVATELAALDKEKPEIVWG